MPQDLTIRFKAEGDILMLDCSIKAVDAGATVLTFDGSA